MKTHNSRLAAAIASVFFATVFVMLAALQSCTLAHAKAATAHGPPSAPPVPLMSDTAPAER